MSVFKEVTFGFKGEEYTVAPNKIMRLIELVDGIVTLQVLTSGDVRLSKLAEAYTACLTYAGAKVEQEAVYESLFGEGGASSVQNTITALIMLLLPPSTYNPPEATNAKKPKKTKTGV